MNIGLIIYDPIETLTSDYIYNLQLQDELMHPAFSESIND